ncbi:MAG TPA: hypothetical protein VE961_19565 [Pyrinomonadaceae bacterium]|nr:hypothetical protein [Pyrinomonadaceae bacterium]
MSIAINCHQLPLALASGQQQKQKALAELLREIILMALAKAEVRSLL